MALSATIGGIPNGADIPRRRWALNLGLIISLHDNLTVVDQSALEFHVENPPVRNSMTRYCKMAQLSLVKNCCSAWTRPMRPLPTTASTETARICFYLATQSSAKRPTSPPQDAILPHTEATPSCGHRTRL